MAIMYGKLVPVTALHQMYISISSLMAHEGLGVAEVVRLGMTKILPHESICLFIIVISEGKGCQHIRTRSCWHTYLLEASPSELFVRK